MEKKMPTGIIKLLPLILRASKRGGKKSIIHDLIEANSIWLSFRNRISQMQCSLWFDGYWCCVMAFTQCGLSQLYTLNWWHLWSPCSTIGCISSCYVQSFMNHLTDTIKIWVRHELQVWFHSGQPSFLLTALAIFPSMKRAW